MQSKRKSFFAGNTVPLRGETGGILYNRYTDLGEVLLEPEVKTDAPPALTFEQTEKKSKKRKDQEETKPTAIDALTDALFNEIPKEPKVRKKARWTDDQKAAAKVERDAERAARKAAGLPEPTVEPAGDAATAEKKKKDKKKDAVPVVRKLAPEERISGPGNAEEAAKIRETLGFVAPAAAPAPAGGFSFGFTAAPAAAHNGATPAAVAGAGPSTSEETSASDSDSDDEHAKVAPVAVPVAVKVPASSDDDSSSSDSDDSSSDEEEEKKPAQKAVSTSSSDEDTSSSDSDSEDDKQPTAAPIQLTTQQYDNYPPTSGPTTTTTAPAPAAVGVGGVSPLDSEFVPRRVYVGGMPYGYTETDVRGFWEYCGPIESIDLLTFPDTGRFRGIAFITFTTEEGYAAALGCDGEACDGQTVKVQKCKWSAKDRRAAMMAGQQGQTPGQPPQQQQYNQQYDNSQGTAPGIHSAVPPPAFGEDASAAAASPWEARPAPASAPVRAPAPKIAGYDVAYVGNVAYEADDAALRALFEPFGVTKVRLHTDKDTGRPKGFAHVHFKDEASLDAAMSLDGTQLFGRKIRVGYAQPKKEAPAV